MIESASPPTGALPRASTGITGLDEITAAGPPRGWTTRVNGRAGCGKRLHAIEFLILRSSR